MNSVVQWSRSRLVMLRRALGLTAGAVLCAWCAAAGAATPLASVTLVPDVALPLGSNNLSATPQQPSTYVPGGAATDLALPPGLPNGVAIVAYDFVPGAAQPHRLVFDTTVTLGGVTFTPRDVAQTDGTGAWSRYLDGGVVGLPSGVGIDALAHDPVTGQLLFSLDSFAALPGGLSLDPRGVAGHDGAAFTLAHDFSALIPAGANLSNLHVLPNGRLLVGLDTTAVVGGVTAHDEDILEHDPAAGTWGLAFAGATLDTDLAAAGLSAFAASPVVVAPPPGITVRAAPGLSTSEGGGMASFTVVLNSAPTADVMVGLSLSDPAEGTLSTVSLVFTPANWNLPQTVTVTGRADGRVDGDKPYTMLTSPAVSADPAYSGLDAADVALVNRDSVPGGAQVASIPTLSEWGLWLLAGLVMGLGLRVRADRSNPQIGQPRKGST